MKRTLSIVLSIVILMSVLTVGYSAESVDKTQTGMPQPYYYGEIDGDYYVTVLDATVLQMHLAKTQELDELRYRLADVNGDGDVNILDATVIQQYIAKIIKHLPRSNECLFSLVNIKSVTPDIPSGKGTYENEVTFTIDAEVTEEVIDTGKLSYVITIHGITNDKLSYTFEMEEYEYGEKNDSFCFAFAEAGLYKISVEATNEYDDKDVFEFNYEVLDTTAFDGKLFVDYDYKDMNFATSYPYLIDGTTEIAFNTECNSATRNISGYGENTTSDRFLAVVSSKQEYDKLFEIDNQHFTDEFFEEKSLVVAVTLGSDYYSLAPIEGLYVKDGVLYVYVHQHNNNPVVSDPPIALPMETLWYSFVSVDKVELSGITSVQRVRK